LALVHFVPAVSSFALVPTIPLTPIQDQRNPFVIDGDLVAILFLRPAGSILGSFLNFGIHVALAWD
jgi:hypothetical protein